MSRVRKFAIAGGTFSVALGIGFVMQNGDALAARFADSRPQAQAPVPPAPVLGAAATPATVAPEAEQVTAFSPVAAPVQAAAPSGMTLPSETGVPAMGDATAVVTFETEDVTEPMLTAVADTIAPADMIGMAGELFGSVVARFPGIGAVGDLPAMPFDIPTDGAPVPVALETDPTNDADSAAPGMEAGCAVTMEASVLPAGLVNLTVTAPCAPQAQTTFHHQGMMFGGITDADGLVSVVVPALAESAVFIVDLAEGQGAVAVVEVPEVAGLNRAVLQWEGVTGLSLHAREFGADYGSAGHVWSAAPRDPAASLVAEGGFLIELGDPDSVSGLFAQVYTFPSQVNARSGDVLLTVEAEVSDANCGRDIAAQSIQIMPDEEGTAQDLSMTMPDCSATGELLVLPGMLQDLHMAAN